jgi:hypothetical protein
LFPLFDKKHRALFDEICEEMKIREYRRCASVVLGVAMAITAAEAHSYYIDPLYGNDANTGMSTAKPWQSFKNIADKSFAPGDSILLRAGRTFNTPLEVTVAGTAKQRIVLGRYGTGNDPCIACDGSKQYAVHVYNCDYLTVEDLDITNRGEEREGLRTGIKIECNEYGYSRGLVIHRLRVHDVNGELTSDKKGGSGILVENVYHKTFTAFDDLLIEDCVVSRCERNGISFRSNTDRRQWFPSKNIVIRANLIDEVPGDGIVPFGADGTIIEYNMMRNSPRTLPTQECAAGFWPGNSDNTIVRYNEVSGCNASWDGQAFDSDFNCQNTTIEYNYSHDNEGGFLLVCCPGEGIYDMTGKLGNTGTRVRYNVSVNDGLRPIPSRQGVYSPIIHIGGTAEDTEISYNILHANQNPVEGMDNCVIASDSWGGYSDNTRYLNNVFYAASPYTFRFSKSTNDLFRGNYFLGEFTHRPTDKKARTKSAYYESLLQGDPGGFGMAESVLSTRTIANGQAVLHYVNPKAIKKLFKKL